MVASIKNFDDLPATINAKQLSALLGISRAKAYQLMHTRGFPLLKIGKRLLVSKQKLQIWLEENAEN